MKNLNYFKQTYESGSISPREVMVPKQEIERVVSTLDEQSHKGSARMITGSFDPVIGRAWFVLGGVVEYKVKVSGDAQTLNILHETQKGLTNLIETYKLPLPKSN